MGGMYTTVIPLSLGWMGGIYTTVLTLRRMSRGILRPVSLLVDTPAQAPLSGEYASQNSDIPDKRERFKTDLSPFYKKVEV